MPGLVLAERFYADAVRPVLEAHFRGIPHSAALIGSGSEVLGFDTPRSMDHHWGPRLQLFLDENSNTELKKRVDTALSLHLPPRFHEFPTNFGPPDSIGVRIPQPVESGPVSHMVEIDTIPRYVQGTLGVNIDSSLTNRDWLLVPQQRLLELTAGRVFHDDLGFSVVRERFTWYPHDVWLYLLAAQWKRIAQEEAFVGRSGDVGDELGSSVIAARLVRDIMRLMFLMERRYAPYSKWLGTAFLRLSAAQALEPTLQAILRSETWKRREHHLSSAYRVVARMHNDLRLTAPLSTEVTSYHDRPYQVINAERFSNAIKAQIRDAELRSLPDVGGIDQVVDSVDLLTNSRLIQVLSRLFDPPAGE